MRNFKQYEILCFFFLKSVTTVSEKSENRLKILLH
jgi:hypothetical protein